MPPPPPFRPQQSARACRRRQRRCGRWSQPRRLRRGLVGRSEARVLCLACPNSETQPLERDSRAAVCPWNRRGTAAFSLLSSRPSQNVPAAAAHPETGMSRVAGREPSGRWSRGGGGGGRPLFYCSAHRGVARRSNRPVALSRVERRARSFSEGSQGVKSQGRYVRRTRVVVAPKGKGLCVGREGRVQAAPC